MLFPSDIFVTLTKKVTNTDCVCLKQLEWSKQQDLLIQPIKHIFFFSKMGGAVYLICSSTKDHKNCDIFI